ncbi:MAG: ATP-binding protein [Chloroflexota bacterium]
MEQQSLNFTVDAKLLQELGERLVGKPAIALAELVKNAYDADAKFTEIVFDPDKDLKSKDYEKGEIIVRDDGHGMTFDEFRNFWMRIGTTHKSEKQKSPYFQRQMTGSKGVGRLSVQFLAHRLELKTVPQRKNESLPWIWAYVDWDDAVNAGDLTSATVVYEIRNDPPPFEYGTELRLEGLKQTWETDDLKSLAREIWWLQPPFRKEIRSLPSAEQFEIRFIGNEVAFEEFRQQIDAVLRIQMARILGTYHAGVTKVAIEFWQRGTKYETFRHEFTLSDIALSEYKDKVYSTKSNLNDAEFEIRIYKAEGKQPFGVSVDELREYLERFAGVHVYDGPFHLPYYGTPQNDWLGIESDHAHRKFISSLLPESLQEIFKNTERLRYLPTQRRIIGSVRINTTKEKNLQIQITRDRLIYSQAHEDLKNIVRYTMDLYAYHAARKAYDEKSQGGKIEKPSEVIRRIEDVLAKYKHDIPQHVYRPLENNLMQVTKSIETAVDAEKDVNLTNLSLLAPLATAGISALAIQHELRKQFGRLEDVIENLTSIHTSNRQLDSRIAQLAEDLQEWLERARTTNMLFDYMTGDTIKERQRYRARTVVENILAQMTFMSRGVDVDVKDLDASLYLPEASFAEWGAIMQNVFSNAFNAMLGSERRVLSISSSSNQKRHILLIQDTGKGVDLKRAEKLFEPFEREMEYEPERIRLGYGGTGLGLTIVRLLSNRIGCFARFVKPEDGFATAFALEWQEKVAQRPERATSRP